jgi:hypothetical protein
MFFHLFSDAFSLILRRFFTHFLLKDHPSAAEQINKNSKFVRGLSAKLSLHFGVSGYRTVSCKSHVDTTPYYLLTYSLGRLGLGLQVSKAPQRAHKALRVPKFCPTLR